MKPNMKLHNIFNEHKRVIEKEETDGIYEIVCSCQKSYIGQTKRKIKTRVKEHQRYIAKQTVSSELSQHVIEEGHHIVGYRKVKTVRTQKERDIWEAAFIIKRGDKLIKKRSGNLREQWGKLLRRERVIRNQ